MAQQIHRMAERKFAGSGFLCVANVFCGDARRPIIPDIILYLIALAHNQIMNPHQHRAVS